MFDADDRVLYHDMLKPPPGFEIDFVLGTTYSLDLSALLMGAMALSGFHYADSGEAIADPVALLKAVRDIKNRCVVFYQHDRQHLPRFASILFGFFNNVVIPVFPGEDSAFHPKIWILRMIQAETVKYRIACLSRNIAFDTSWDTSLIMDGELTTGKTDTRLQAMIGDLQRLAGDQIDTTVAAAMERMGEELCTVKWELSFPFVGDPVFHFLKKGVALEKVLPEKTTEFLVISPFLSISFLQKLLAANPGGKCQLLSRAESLETIRTQKDGEHILGQFQQLFCLRETEQQEQEAHVLSDLHAKMVITRTGNEIALFTGSANATRNGMSGVNFEFMTELHSCDKSLFPSNLLTEGSLGKISIPYSLEIPVQQDADEVAQTLTKNLETIKARVIHACKKIIVRETGGEALVEILFEQLDLQDLDHEVSCWMLGEKEDKASMIPCDTKTFQLPLGKRELPLISAFLAFRIRTFYQSKNKATCFVVKVPLEGMIWNQEALLFKHIIKDQEHFLRYLLMLLGMQEGTGTFFPGQRAASGLQGSGTAADILRGIYTEDLLQTYSRNPKILMRIKKEIGEMKELGIDLDRIPPAFRKVWQAFDEVLQDD